MPDNRPNPSRPPQARPSSASPRSSPLISGTFYLFTSAVTLTIIAAIGGALPVYVPVLVFIGGAIIVVAVGSLQLKQSDRFKDADLSTLTTETLKRLPAVKTVISSQPSSDSDRQNR